MQLPEFRGGCILLGLLQGQYALSDKEVAAEFVSLAQATQDHQQQQGQGQPQGAFVLFDGFCQWAVGRLIADAQLSEGVSEETEEAPSDSRGGGGGGRSGRSSPTPVRGAQGQQQLLSMGREVVEALIEVSIELTRAHTLTHTHTHKHIHTQNMHIRSYVCM